MPIWAANLAFFDDVTFICSYSSHNKLIHCSMLLWSFHYYYSNFYIPICFFIHQIQREKYIQKHRSVSIAVPFVLHRKFCIFFYSLSLSRSLCTVFLLFDHTHGKNQAHKRDSLSFINGKMCICNKSYGHLTHCKLLCFFPFYDALVEAAATRWYCKIVSSSIILLWNSLVVSSLCSQVSFVWV